MKDIKGFTLIELLIVIAIIGILASAVIVSLGGLTETSKDAVNKRLASQLAPVALAYYSENNNSYNSMCPRSDGADFDGGDGEFEKVLNAIKTSIADTSNVANESSDKNGSGSGKVKCITDGSNWVVSFDLLDSTNWCVSNEGAGQTANLITSPGDDCDA